MPPSKLLSAASVTSTQEPPEWATAATAPTDIALLQKAQEARLRGHQEREKQQQVEETSNFLFHDALQKQQVEPFSDEEDSSDCSDWENLQESMFTIDEAINESRFDDEDEALEYMELENKYRLALVAAGLSVKKRRAFSGTTPGSQKKIKSCSLIVSTMIQEDEETNSIGDCFSPMFPDLVRHESTNSLPMLSDSDNDNIMTRGFNSSPSLGCSSIELDNFPVSHRGLPLQMHRKLVGVTKQKSGVMIVASWWFTTRRVLVLVVIVIVFLCSSSHFGIRFDNQITTAVVPAHKVHSIVDSPEYELFPYSIPTVELTTLEEKEEIPISAEKDVSNSGGIVQMEYLETLLDALMYPGQKPTTTPLIKRESHGRILRPVIQYMQNLDPSHEKVLSLFFKPKSA